MLVAQCELSNWVDVLDKLDDVLERCCKADPTSQWMLACDLPGSEADKHLLLTVLQFTALLVEQSFSRHLYSSMDHLTTLLSSGDMTVVLAVLDVLYMFRYAVAPPATDSLLCMNCEVFFCVVGLWRGIFNIFSHSCLPFLLSCKVHHYYSLVTILYCK